MPDGIKDRFERAWKAVCSSAGRGDEEAMEIVEKFSPLNVYNNPDRRCKYPFTPDSLGYCWGFANFVDRGDEFLSQQGVSTMEEYCLTCEFWRPSVVGSERKTDKHVNIVLNGITMPAGEPVHDYMHDHNCAVMAAEAYCQRHKLEWTIESLNGKYRVWIYEKELDTTNLVAKDVETAAAAISLGVYNHFVGDIQR